MAVAHDGSYATVAARTDVDQACPTIVYDPDRRLDEDHMVEMTPAEARKLAKRLNRAAKAADLMADRGSGRR